MPDRRPRERFALHQFVAAWVKVINVNTLRP